MVILGRDLTTIVVEGVGRKERKNQGVENILENQQDQAAATKNHAWSMVTVLQPREQPPPCIEPPF